jgi:hypothetical protein
MRPHVDVLGWLHVIWGGFGLLTGGGLLLLAAGALIALRDLQPAGADPSAVWFLGGTGTVLAAAGGVLAWTGRRLLAHDQGGRRAALWLAIPNCLLLPFGTMLGVYSLWTLLNDDARRIFGRPVRLGPPGAP